MKLKYLQNFQVLEGQTYQTTTNNYLITKYPLKHSVAAIKPIAYLAAGGKPIAYLAAGGVNGSSRPPRNEEDTLSSTLEQQQIHSALLLSSEQKAHEYYSYNTIIPTSFIHTIISSTKINDDERIFKGES